MIVGLLMIGYLIKETKLLYKKTNVFPEAPT